MTIDDLPIEGVGGNFEGSIDRVYDYTQVLLNLPQKALLVVPDATSTVVHQAGVEASTAAT